MVHWIRFFYSFINNQKNKETEKIIIESNKIKRSVNKNNNNKIMSMIFLLFFGFYIPNSLSMLSTSHFFDNTAIISTIDNINMINTTLSNHKKNMLSLVHNDNVKLTTDTVLYSSGIYDLSYTL